MIFPTKPILLLWQVRPPSMSLKQVIAYSILSMKVEVCDICGDAGQEDLLAICSKCSDGAEHTYCMREMLQKVPEGYWLCEECKLVEEIENQKQGLDVEGEKANKLSSSIQSLARGHEENREGALSLTRKAVDTGMGSPKSLSPSMQSLDKGKVKPYLQNPFGKNDNDMHENVRSPTSGTQLQTTKGTLFKSNSFNTSSSKPKVKLVDKVDQKLRPRTDTISHSSASNKRETKVVQSAGKQSTLSRSTSNLAHKGVESAVTSVPSINGPISSEEKLNQLSQMEEPSSSSSWTAEKQPNNFDGVMSDGLSLSLDSTSLSEKSREDIYKGNKLKAAIEAANRLRPGIRKRASHVPSSISKKAKSMISVEGIHDRQESIRNQTSISNIKLLNSHSTDAVSVSVVSSVHNPSMREIFIPPLALGSSVSKISAIPKLEYIWQ